MLLTALTFQMTLTPIVGEVLSPQSASTSFGSKAKD